MVAGRAGTAILSVRFAKCFVGAGRHGWSAVWARALVYCGKSEQQNHNITLPLPLFPQSFIYGCLERDNGEKRDTDLCRSRRPCTRRTKRCWSKRANCRPRSDMLPKKLPGPNHCRHRSWVQSSIQLHNRRGNRRWYAGTLDVLRALNPPRGCIGPSWSTPHLLPTRHQKR